MKLSETAKLLTTGTITATQRIQSNGDHQIQEMLNAIRYELWQERDIEHIIAMLFDWIEINNKLLQGLPVQFRRLTQTLYEYKNLTGQLPRNQFREKLIDKFHMMFQESQVSMIGIRTLEEIYTTFFPENSPYQYRAKVYIKDAKIFYKIEKKDNDGWSFVLEKNGFNANQHTINMSIDEFRIFKLAGKMNKNDKTIEEAGLRLNFDRADRCRPRQDNPVQFVKNLRDKTLAELDENSQSFNSFKREMVVISNTSAKYYQDKIDECKNGIEYHSQMQMESFNEDCYHQDQISKLNERIKQLEHEILAIVEKIENDTIVVPDDNQPFAPKEFFQDLIASGKPFEEEMLYFKEVLQNLLSYEAIFDVECYEQMSIRKNIKNELEIFSKYLKEIYGIDYFFDELIKEFDLNYENYENDHIPATKFLTDKFSPGSQKEKNKIRADGICIRFPTLVHKAGRAHGKGGESKNSFGLELYLDIEAHIQNLEEFSIFQNQTAPDDVDTQYAPLLAIGALRYLYKHNIKQYYRVQRMSDEEKMRLDNLLMKSLQSSIKNARLRDVGIGKQD